MNNEAPILLHCENVHKSYKMTAKPVEVLHGLSLTIRKGSTLAIMGASGSGKSTLLHVLGGLDKPEQGQVYFNNTNIYKMPKRKRSRWLSDEVGFVFQAYHLLPELSILENVMLPALNRSDAMRRASEFRTRARDLLDRVGLADRAEHRSTELSGGEQQRAALARSLMNQPSIVLADEPTGNLDSETGGQVLDYLLKLGKENNQTLVMVTHNQTVAELADSMVFLRDGTINNESAF